MLNRIRNCLRFAGCFSRCLGGLPLDTVHGSDKWFIGSDNLSLLPIAKIVHVNLCVVCAFSDCDVLHFTMFLKKFLSLKSFEALLQIWLVPSRFSFPPFLCSSILLFLYFFVPLFFIFSFFSLFPLFFCSFVAMFLFFSVPVFLCSSVSLFFCSSLPVFLCSSIILFFCLSLLLCSLYLRFPVFLHLIFRVPSTLPLHVFPASCIPLSRSIVIFFLYSHIFRDTIPSFDHSLVFPFPPLS